MPLPSEPCAYMQASQFRAPASFTVGVCCAYDHSTAAAVVCCLMQQCRAFHAAGALPLSTAARSVPQHDTAQQLQICNKLVFAQEASTVAAWQGVLHVRGDLLDPMLPRIVMQQCAYADHGAVALVSIQHCVQSVYHPAVLLKAMQLQGRRWTTCFGRPIVLAMCTMHALSIREHTHSIIPWS